MATPSPQTLPTFWSALSAIKPDSNEEVVRILWTAIAIEWFPQREGYRFSFKGRGPILINNNNNNQPGVGSGITVFQTMHRGTEARLPTQVSAHMILQIECKQPSEDTSTSWKEAEEGHVQVVEDSRSDRLFSVIAIGKKAKFYRYDRTAQVKMSPLHEGTIAMDVENGGVEQVEQMMNVVKGQAWQWASSS